MTLEFDSFLILIAYLRCGPICCPFSMGSVFVLF